MKLCLIFVSDLHDSHVFVRSFLQIEPLSNVTLDEASSEQVASRNIKDETPAGYIDEGGTQKSDITREGKETGDDVSYNIGYIVGSPSRSTALSPKPSPTTTTSPTTNGVELSTAESKEEEVCTEPGRFLQRKFITRGGRMPWH